ncbi:peptidase M28 [Polychaeton citri CBS 116435]|uniref:Peptidase M28 n=1 Tax=Polychaeton citri CBS 116435 TaxID=1314669 RepID=A0A9P4Q7D8_9PEZI|nr:peptidase M28 [Polychaeton citri CBS 116435]
MPTETSPLIERVPVAEPQERYPHHRLRRFCTIALVAIPLTTLVIIFIAIGIGGDNDLFGDHGSTDILPWFSTLFPKQSRALPHDEWPAPIGMTFEGLKDVLLHTPSPEKAREWSKYYTAGPHLAGKNLSQAEWTRDKWIEFGVEQSEVVPYEVYINYPKDHRLALLKDGELDYEASLEEDVLPEDSTTGLPDRIPTFHGYSASGNVTAQYVFCNYGTYADFGDLLEAGVDLKGKIALVKYGGIFRGLKVKRAGELGMIGTVIYSDPGDDGEITEENGYATYPDGPARNPSSVQRGSVQYLSNAPGDPTTIGYPSKPGCDRQPVEGKIPSIPSIPISYTDALPLLRALNSYGPNASSFSREAWHYGGLGYKGVEYNIGPSPAGVELNLMNLVEYEITPLWNAIGIINGTLSSEVVVIGNHRDAWIAGGAGDPNSGSAALNEVIRSFGVALKKGWKPLRTIVFASWDGEEYGLVGSTEWVEEYLPWLKDASVAYLNVDVGARGDKFEASASPILNRVLYDVTSQVPSPNQTVKGQTVRDLWDGKIRNMGSGSDFTAFQDFAGISSLDMGFGDSSSDAIYHYHSNYDSFHWMDKFGDKTWEYHTTIAKVWSLLTATLVETPIVTLNATDYAEALQNYFKSLEHDAMSLYDNAISTETKPDFHKIAVAISSLHAAAIEFDARAAAVASEVTSTYLSANFVPQSYKLELYSKVAKINSQYKRFERAFLYQPGLDSRNWFKHVVFAPGLWTGYAGATFPGLREAIEFGHDGDVAKWVGIIAGRVWQARGVLGE